LVSLLDVSAPEAEIKIFEIKYGDAQSLIKAIQGLIPSNVEGTPGPRLPGSAGEDALIPIRLFPDVRTNTILAAGSVSDMKTIEALVMTLDREDLLSRKHQVYPLKNKKAVIIEIDPRTGMSVVTGGISATINKYIRDQLIIQQESPGVISPYQQIESAVIDVPDAESNSLIISATPRYFDEIIDLIKELDKSPPQVLIKVLIAEITLAQDKEWAAELGFQDPLMFLRGSGMFFNNRDSQNNLSLPANGHLPGTVGTQMLSNFGAGRDGGGGGLIFSASSEYLNIMLRALHEKRRLEVLSSPQITTMNNVEAKVSVGQKVPRVKGTTVNQGVTNENIDDEEVVLELIVTPTISPEGTIVMEVKLQKAKIGREIQVGSSSAKTTIVDIATLETMISAANNQTVVLGGLITKDEDKIVRKVPLLGDIPYLGKLWRHETSKTERKELLVILTPRIVHSADENEMNDIKQMELARMSWCLSNVVETYGDIGAYNVVSERPYTGNAPVSTPGPVKAETLQPLESNFLLPTLPKRD
jgi:type II secretion system protein D